MNESLQYGGDADPTLPMDGAGDGPPLSSEVAAMLQKEREDAEMACNSPEKQPREATC